MLPIYDLPLLKTNVKEFAKYVNQFISPSEFNRSYFAWKLPWGTYWTAGFFVIFPKTSKDLSSQVVLGYMKTLWVKAIPKREDKDYMTRKCQEVFYDPKVATDEIIDEVFETVNDRKKLVKILAIAKSAIRHNMAKDLPKIQIPTAIIWGENDIVTPPEVGHDFRSFTTKFFFVLD